MLSAGMAVTQGGCTGFGMQVTPSRCGARLPDELTLQSRLTYGSLADRVLNGASTTDTKRCLPIGLFASTTVAKQKPQNTQRIRSI